MKTGGEVTAEYADTPDRQRLVAIALLRADRQRWAREVDPEAFAKFEQKKS